LLLPAPRTLPFIFSKGELRWPNGDTYVGGFKADIFDGVGVWTGADGGKYEGEWKVRADFK
jgi:hypothetical protein